MNYFFRLLIILIFLFASTAEVSFAAGIPGYKLEIVDPNQSICVGKAFQARIYINTNGTESINGDVLLNFDPAKINIESAATENFFTFAFATHISGTNNKYLASSWEQSIAYTKSSTDFQPFYTLNLKAVSAGSSQLTFECVNGSEADTNINRASDSKDIVSCPLPAITIPVSATCAAGPTVTTAPGEPTVTTAPGEPTATTAPGGNGNGAGPTDVPPTDTPTPVPPTDVPQVQVTAMPRAGIAEVTFGAFGLGAILTVIGLLFML